MTRRPRDRLALLPAAILLLLLAGGCRHGGAGTDERPPPGPGVPAPAYYDAGGAAPTALSSELYWRREHASFRRIELPPRSVPALEAVPGVQDPIEIFLLRPEPCAPDRRPLVLMFPILGNGLTAMCEVGTGFVRQGYVVAIVPRKELAFDPRRSIDMAEEESRVAVMRGKQALDWLVQQPIIDPDRIGFFGISAGGILGATMMGADPRVKAGVLVFAGGPMADVIAYTSEDDMAERMRMLHRVRGWSRERSRDELLRRLDTDPIKLASRVSREDVLMFIASGDTSVPTRLQWNLWEALGRPAYYELKGGHYRGFLFNFFFILRKSQAFLGARLGTP